jgi:hypothetical protein
MSKSPMGVIHVHGEFPDMYIHFRPSDGAYYVARGLVGACGFTQYSALALMIQSGKPGFGVWEPFDKNVKFTYMKGLTH